MSMRFGTSMIFLSFPKFFRTLKLFWIRAIDFLALRSLSVVDRPGG
jgi:hypothetical protein